ncbi:hypothetical protein [Neptunicella sp. SCSIO 80796]|uniref:hypothetical protein n=1 Tax=Neptunicella plasticusilytica TaxID=3117012 RepID=UPI003A4E66F4
MFTCPSCGKKGVGFWSKLWSGSDTPSKCKFCGALSCVHSKYRFGWQNAWPTVVKLVGAGLCFYLFNLFNNPYYLLLFPVIWLVCSVWELATLPMTLITEQQSLEVKKYGNWFVFGILSLLLVLYVTSNL